MRRGVIGVMSGVSLVVIGLSWKASSVNHTGALAAGAPVGIVSTTTASPTPAATASAAPKATTTKSVTVNGQAVDTRYGPVQVQITVRNKQIVAADAITYPSGDPRDQQINSYAIPVLDSAALQAQSAQVDTVSGATFTSDGYRQSLQSAIDAATSAGAL